MGSIYEVKWADEVVVPGDLNEVEGYLKIKQGKEVSQSWEQYCCHGYYAATAVWLPSYDFRSQIAFARVIPVHVLEFCVS